MKTAGCNKMMYGSDDLCLLLRRQGECYGLMLKMVFVRAIAKGLVLRQAATAQRHYLPALQVVSIACFVHYLKVAFYL